MEARTVRDRIPARVNRFLREAGEPPLDEAIVGEPEAMESGSFRLVAGGGLSYYLYPVELFKVEDLADGWAMFTRYHMGQPTTAYLVPVDR